MEQTTWKGTVVKPLSEQLSELAARVKTAEDILAAANQKDRAALESQREQLKSSINKAKDQGKTAAAAMQDQGQSWWTRRGLMSINGSIRYGPSGMSTAQNAI
jgi:uncharacterized protein YlxW (UPF0749 family)